MEKYFINIRGRIWCTNMTLDEAKKEYRYLQTIDSRITRYNKLINKHSNVL